MLIMVPYHVDHGYTLLLGMPNQEIKFTIHHCDHTECSEVCLALNTFNSLLELYTGIITTDVVLCN